MFLSLKWKHNLNDILTVSDQTASLALEPVLKFSLILGDNKNISNDGRILLLSVCCIKERTRVSVLIYPYA